MSQALDLWEIPSNFIIRREHCSLSSIADVYNAVPVIVGIRIYQRDDTHDPGCLALLYCAIVLPDGRRHVESSRSCCILSKFDIGWGPVDCNGFYPLSASLPVAQCQKGMSCMRGTNGLRLRQCRAEDPRI
jgi:hypothetical protein